MRENKIRPRVVVLGAAGFIGLYLAKAFILNGHIVIAVDNFIRGKSDKDFQELMLNANFTFLEIDLSLESNYLNLFEPGDLVYNCVALNGTQNFYTNPFKVIQNSAIPGILIPKYAARANVLRYTYFGSSESYAGGLSLGLIKVPTPENVPLTIPDVAEVRWSYAASKTMGEVAAFAAHKEFGLVIQILRLHNIYGARMGDKHVIPDLVIKFSKGNMSVHGADESRSFFYIEDLVNVLLQLAKLDSVPDVLNVGSNREILIKDLASLIMREMGLDNNLTFVAPFSGSVHKRCPDVSLLKALVDYDETLLEEGIAKTVEWYLKSI